MDFRVLGSIEVRRDGDIVQVGSRNERKLLAALLVDANSVVSTSRLIAVVWADDPPRSDRNALQTYGGFAEAAREAGRSRVYGGVHFQFRNDAGPEAGKSIGQEIVRTRLLRAGSEPGAGAACTGRR